MNLPSNYHGSTFRLFQQYLRTISSLTSKCGLYYTCCDKRLANVNLSQKSSYTSRLLHNHTKTLLAFRYGWKLFLWPSFKNIHSGTVHHRFISTSALLLHGDDDLRDIPETVRVTFIEKDGTRKEVMGKVGERAMYLAHRKGIDMEGACEASLACTTCHCYVESSDEHWDLLPEATEKEEDLLDMAPFLDVYSRLGCQIILSQELDGIVLKLPRATKNFYVDGHKPQPH